MLLIEEALVVVVNAVAVLRPPNFGASFRAIDSVAGSSDLGWAYIVYKNL